MQDSELYQQILGLTVPWTVVSVRLNLEEGEVVVEVARSAGTRSCCPECHPLKKVARTIRERIDNVANYCQHEITNAVAEGINCKVQSIKHRVGGFRNKQNYKTAIFFHCGGLDLHPR